MTTRKWSGFAGAFVTSATSLLAIAPTPALAASVGPKIDFVDPMGGSGVGRGGDLSPVGMFMTADGVVQAVVILLLITSVITWTVGIAKWRELKANRQRLEVAIRKLIGAADIAAVGETGCAQVAEMILQAEDEIAASARVGDMMPGEGVKERITLRLERVEAAARRQAGRGVGILAIIGSSAPFVGLFGTVWGIMNSFIGIAESRTTNLAVVAPGIAEALLTTAVGLVAAIPAAVLYNVFARALSVYSGELGDAGAAVSCLAGREVDHAEDRS